MVQELETLDFLVVLTWWENMGSITAQDSSVQSPLVAISRIEPKWSATKNFDTVMGEFDVLLEPALDVSVFETRCKNDGTDLTHNGFPGV